ncbi:MAG: hypothetical protein FD174_929 [Geobacteraceae bacterium]|nr:MAG: hypothetical protein FD174_929 [Geobacteraceae bacterium]
MKSLREMSIGEIAAYVAEHLRQSGINVVLTGGSCVSIYTDNRYQSYDLDFIEEGSSGRKTISGILMKLGFQEKDRYFIHPDTPFFVEFPAGPLAIGDEPVREVANLEFATGTLRLLSPTDCVKDRLAHYYHWKDRQCLDQAVMVAAVSQVDMEEIERWSRHEGMEDEFQRIKEMLQAKT